MKKLRPSYLWVLPIALVFVLALVSGAVAFWSAAGSGTATSAVAAPQPLTFAPGAAASQLYPGAASDVAIVATNPNAFVVQVDSLALDLAAAEPIEVDAGHAGCEVSALHFTTQDDEGNGWQVPARVGATDGTLAINLPASLAMSIEAASACQGATFTVHVEASR
jgi:hypothetical protein